MSLQMSHILPLELWQQIFTHCQPNDRCSLATTCKELLALLPAKQLKVNVLAAAEEYEALKWFVDYFRVDKRKINRKLLQKAVKTGNLQSLQRVVKIFNPKRNDITYQECQPVITAAISGHIHIIQWLIDRYQLTKTDLTVKRHTYSQDNITVLVAAAHRGHLDIMQYLVDKLSISTEDLVKGRHYLLHFTAESGNIQALDWLCQQFPDVVSVYELLDRNTFERVIHQLHVLQWIYGKWPDIYRKFGEGKRQVVDAFHRCITLAQLDSAKWIMTTFPFIRKEVHLPGRLLSVCAKWN